MSDLVIVTLKMSPDFRDRLRGVAEATSRSVSALLLEGAAILVARIDGGVSLPIMPEIVANDEVAEREAKLAAAEARCVRLDAVVLDQERQLGMWQARAERAEHAAKVMADHKMITPAQVINPRPHGMPADRASPKPVAAILPITGTEFPRQLTHWQKQQAKPKKAGK